MIYEMRVYRCVPGRLPALLKRFETALFPRAVPADLRSLAGALGCALAEDVTSAQLALGQAQRNLVQARVTAQLALIRLQNAAGGAQ